MAPDVSMPILYGCDIPRKRTNLQSDVQQLVRQKGQFRTVTERSLLADTENSARGGQQDNEGSAQDDDFTPETAHQKTDKLFQQAATWHQTSL